MGCFSSGQVDSLAQTEINTRVLIVQRMSPLANELRTPLATSTINLMRSWRTCGERRWSIVTSCSAGR